MATTQLDITRYNCPITFVKVKVRLFQMEKGDVLEVLLRGEEPLENVPATAIREGHVVLGTTHVKDNVYMVKIQK
ncbi:MAG: sulfurtransferase TusA family protein [Solidesulfovibrio sp.]